MISIIKLSQLKRMHRLDAEYYQPTYLKLEDVLDKIGFKTLENISTIITDGDHGNPEYARQGILYIKSKNVNEFLIEADSAQRISVDYAKKIRKDCFTEQNDILLTTIGSIGTSTVNSFSGQIALSRDLARIHINKESSFLPEFIAVFFNSKIGLALTERESVGTVQRGLYLNIIRKLKIPDVDINFQEEIRNLFLEARKKFLNSKSFYFQAENLLLEKLGLKGFNVEDELSYTANLSEIKSTHRIDAEYFQPKYEKIFKVIKSPIQKLEKLTKFLNHAKQPPYIGGGKVPIITQKHLGQAFVNLEAIHDPETKYTSNEWFKKYPIYKLRQEDVLYYSVGAYIGKTNIILEDLNATTASFITIIRTKEELNPAYLTAVLNSIIGKLQSDKWQSATAQSYIYPKNIRNFKIPILSKLIQQKIASLVRQSHQTRKKAKELLKEAKQKVEKMIEKRIKTS